MDSTRNACTQQTLAKGHVGTNENAIGASGSLPAKSPPNYIITFGTLIRKDENL